MKPVLVKSQYEFQEPPGPGGLESIPYQDL